MATVTPGMVKELRERTGLGMMDCKKALVAADGDLEQAIEDLRRDSGLKAARKAGRTAAEGMVITRVADDGSYGVLVEINSETDFVARDDDFRQFANTVLDAAFSTRETDVGKLMTDELEADREKLVQKIGENINVRRVETLEAGDGAVGDYVHSNDRIGVLVALKGGDSELARDVAMHVAAVNPMVVRSEEVPEATLKKESDILTAQAQESGKPPEIIEKMIQGRLRKFVAEITLLEQPFVKDPDMTVSELLGKADADVTRFARFEVGEGIEKEEVDFAEEVAAQASGSN